MAISVIGTPTTGTSGASTATSLNINLASTTVGAFNVIGLSINSTASAGDPIPTVPTGWSVIGEKSKTGTPWHHLIVIGRIYQSGDPTSLTISWSLTGNGSAGCAAYSGVDTTTPVITATEVLASSKSASNTSWDTGSITTAGSRWICAAFANRSSGTWSALTDTQRYTQITASSANIAYEDSNGAVASGTYNKTATYSVSTSVGNMVIFALNPATTGTNYSNSPADNVGITDIVSTSLSGSTAPNDPVGITDSVTAILQPTSVSQSDPIGISDSATAIKDTLVSNWLNQTGKLYVAHRGGDNDWVEMTRYAYTQAIANGVTAINIDAVKCSTGEFVASHDTTTGRVFGTNYTIASTPWSTLQSLTTTNGGYPIELVSDLLAAFPNVVVFLENKGNSSDDTALLNMLDSYGGASRIIIKQYYTAATVATDAHARNYTTWGYYYAADLTNLASTQSRWDLLGLDYLDTNAADWTNIKSYGKKVLGHVIPSAAGATQAFSLGADGIMTGKILGVVPGAVNDPVGITDVVTIATGKGQTVSDPVGITDNVSNLLSRVQNPADPVGITDAVSTTLNYIININDVLGITDSPSASGAGNKSSNASESVGITDSIQQSLNGIRTTADSVGISDLVQAGLALPRAATDSVGITDNVTIIMNYNISIADAVGLLDSVGAILGGPKTITNSDGVAIADFVVYSLTSNLPPVVIVFPANPNIGGQSFDYANVKSAIDTLIRLRAANANIGGEWFGYGQ